MPDEEGFSEVGAVVSLEGLDETMGGMDRYNAGIEGMAKETSKQTAQMSAQWEDLSKETRKSLEDTTGAVKEGEDVLGKMPESYRRMKSELTGMGERADKVGKQVDDLHSDIATGTAVTGAAGDAFGKYVMVIGGVIAVAGGAMLAIHAMYGAVERVEPLWAARDAFAALGEQVELTSSSIVRDTQRASRATVSEYKIITSANKDLLAGNDALADSYSDLMDLAYVVARTTGKSTEQQFDAIASAIRSGSQAALEAADVWIDLETAQRAYAKTQNRTLEQLSEEERQLIALQVVLEEMPGYIDRMGGAMDSALEPVRRLTTAVGLLKDELLAAAGAAVMGGLEALGLDLPKSMELIAGRVGLWTETQRLLSEILLSAEEGEISQALADEAIAVSRAALTLEQERNRYLTILGRAPAAAADPYAGISAFERRVLSPEELDKRLAAMRLAEEAAERVVEERGKAKEALLKKAEAYVTRLAPYLTDEELRLLYQRYVEIGERVIDQADDIYGDTAQWELERFTHDMAGLSAELRKVDKGASAAAASIAGMGPFGEWAVEFAAVHGGKTPYEQYERHEEPLVAAVMDKMFGEKVMRETGRPPTREEEVAFWYKVHGPFEVFPGGPIVGQRGPEYEAAKAELAGIPIEDLGKAYHLEWMAEKGLIASTETLKAKEEILADFLVETAIPVREDEAEAIGITTESTEKLGGAMNAVLTMLEAHLQKPPPGGGGEGEGEPPPPPAALALEAGRLKRRPPPPVPVPRGVEKEFYQFGGITTHAQTAELHEDEAVIPFGRPGVAAAILSQMLGRIGVNVGLPGRMGGGGGVNIGAISVPISISGNVTRQTAAMLQTAVVEGVRHRAGAAMRREARRLGL